jgi:hypothetical protein
MLGIFSLVLLLASLFVLRKAENEEQFKNLWLGYPIPFVAQDFSVYNKNFAYFPNYGRLEIHNQNSIINFSIVNFALSGLYFSFFLKY